MTIPATTSATSYTASSTNGGVVTLVSVTIMDEDYLPEESAASALQEEIKAMAEDLLTAVEECTEAV